MIKDLGNKGCFLYTIDQVKEVAQHIVALKDRCSLFVLRGSLGAGKTTLTRSMLKELGVEGSITSPTFTYMNLYQNNQSESFYHFDCYRLSSVDEFIQLGFDEYLYRPNSWAIIEWPEVIAPLLRDKVCYITIEYRDENTRELCYHIQ